MITNLKIKKRRLVNKLNALSCPSFAVMDKEVIRCAYKYLASSILNVLMADNKLNICFDVNRANQLILLGHSSLVQLEFKDNHIRLFRCFL